MAGVRKRTQRAKNEDMNRLNVLRVSRGLTQRELAEEFLVSPGAIALWEQGDRALPGPLLKLLEFYEQGLDKKLKK